MTEDAASTTSNAPEVFRIRFADGAPRLTSSAGSVRAGEAIRPRIGRIAPASPTLAPSSPPETLTAERVSSRARPALARNSRTGAGYTSQLRRSRRWPSWTRCGFSAKRPSPIAAGRWICWASQWGAPRCSWSCWQPCRVATGDGDRLAPSRASSVPLCSCRCFSGARPTTTSRSSICGSSGFAASLSPTLRCR